MASLFTSSQLITQPITRTRHTTTSSSSNPPPHSPSPPPHPASQPLQIIVTQSDQQQQVSSVNKTRSQRGTNAAESTDWIASSLTRRFGLGAGLAWVGFLAVGVVPEQIKTRIEVSQQDANTRYSDLRIGGGASPKTGDLVVIGLKGTVKETGQVFIDTFDDKKKKQLALVMGTRPYTRGMCEGIDYVMRSMKAGGKRSVLVPSNLGFGDEGVDLGNGVIVPGNVSLEYVVEVDRVSIAPA